MRRGVLSHDHNSRANGLQFSRTLSQVKNRGMHEKKMQSEDWMMELGKRKIEGWEGGWSVVMYVEGRRMSCGRLHKQGRWETNSGMIHLKRMKARRSGQRQ